MLDRGIDEAKRSVTVTLQRGAPARSTFLRASRPHPPIPPDPADASAKKKCVLKRRASFGGVIQCEKSVSAPASANQSRAFECRKRQRSAADRGARIVHVARANLRGRDRPWPKRCARAGPRLFEHLAQCCCEERGGDFCCRRQLRCSEVRRGCARETAPRRVPAPTRRFARPSAARSPADRALHPERRRRRRQTRCVRCAASCIRRSRARQVVPESRSPPIDESVHGDNASCRSDESSPVQSSRQVHVGEGGASMASTARLTGTADAF